MKRFISVDSNIKQLEDIEPIFMLESDKAPRAFQVYRKAQIRLETSKKDDNVMDKSSAFGGYK